MTSLLFGWFVFFFVFFSFFFLSLFFPFLQLLITFFALFWWPVGDAVNITFLVLFVDFCVDIIFCFTPYCSVYFHLESHRSFFSPCACDSLSLFLFLSLSLCFSLFFSLSLSPLLISLFLGSLFFLYHVVCRCSIDTPADIWMNVTLHSSRTNEIPSSNRSSPLRCWLKFSFSSWLRYIFFSPLLSVTTPILYSGG